MEKTYQPVVNHSLSQHLANLQLSFTGLGRGVHTQGLYATEPSEWAGKVIKEDLKANSQADTF